MELLTTELGATTIVSVAHRPELEAFHSRKITDAKHKQAFAIALNKITGMGGVEIITDVDAAIVPTPLNSKPIAPTPEASSVIDVMGGGQAVRYTD